MPERLLDPGRLTSLLFLAGAGSAIRAVGPGTGGPEEGYAALAYGLERVRTLAGEPWQAELVKRYQEALRRSAREWLGGNGGRRRGNVSSHDG